MIPGNQKGNTLIEVIIAMLILSLLVVGLNTGVVSLIKSNINSRELTSATAVGNQRFEDFRRGTYAAILATGTSTDIVRERYLRSWTISDHGSQVKIDLTVQWPLDTKKHIIALSTIIARP